MIRRPPRSPRTDPLFPTRRSSVLWPTSSGIGRGAKIPRPFPRRRLRPTPGSRPLSPTRWPMRASCPTCRPNRQRKVTGSHRAGRMSRKLPKTVLPLAALLLVGALGWLWFAQSAPGSRPQVAIMTSLPIYWSEGADVALIASGQGEMPWVRGALETRYRLKPVDTLGAGDGRDPLAGIERLMVVQPRALSPQDNLVLDRWVMAGGHLFMVLDPLLTGQYSVPLGDPRHPVAVGLIPPEIGRAHV